jgi:WD40 repeat protein
MATQSRGHGTHFDVIGDATRLCTYRHGLKVRPEKRQMLTKQIEIGQLAIVSRPRRWLVLFRWLFICFFVLALIGGLFWRWHAFVLGQLTVTAAISPDGKHLARSTGFGISSYDLETGNPIPMLGGGGARPVEFSKDSKHIAAGYLDKVCLWDFREKKLLATWTAKNRWGFRLAFSKDGTILAAADDNFLRVFDVLTYKTLLNVPIGFEHDSVAFSPDGKVVVLGGTPKKEEGPGWHEIKMWDIKSGKLLSTLKGEKYCIVNSLAFSPDGNLLATGLSVQLCQMWDCTKQKILWTTEVGNAYQRLAMVDEGKKVVVAGYQSLAVLDSSNGAKLAKYEFEGSTIECFVSLGNDRPLLVATKNVVYSLDLRSGNKQKVFPK